MQRLSLLSGKPETYLVFTTAPTTPLLVRVPLPRLRLSAGVLTAPRRQHTDVNLTVSRQQL